MEGIIVKAGHGLETVHDLLFFYRDKKGIASYATRKRLGEVSQSILANHFAQLFPRLFAADEASEKHETPLQQVPVAGEDDAVFPFSPQGDLPIVKSRVHNRIEAEYPEEPPNAANVNVCNEGDIASHDVPALPGSTGRVSGECAERLRSCR